MSRTAQPQRLASVLELCNFCSSKTHSGVLHLDPYNRYFQGGILVPALKSPRICLQGRRTSKRQEMRDDPFLSDTQKKLAARFSLRATKLANMEATPSRPCTC